MPDHVPGPVPDALAPLQAAAHEGDPDARFHLATHYRKGQRGLPVDLGEAVRWYRLAAEQGHPQAQYQMGQACMRGDGVAKDRIHARACWMQAAALGNTRAARAVLQLDESKKEGAGLEAPWQFDLVRCRRRADAGHAAGQYQMGYAYSRGKYVEKQPKVAVQWYRLAAGQGCAQARYQMGQACMRGDGVTQDAQAAFRWYQAAAEQGHHWAQHAVAGMYQQGAGVRKDAAAALEWYARAAHSGNPKARRMLVQLAGH